MGTVVYLSKIRHTRMEEAGSTHATRTVYIIVIIIMSVEQQHKLLPLACMPGYIIATTQLIQSKIKCTHKLKQPNCARLYGNDGKLIQCD